MPFFPLGGFSPLQSAALSDVAARLGATPMQVALAWLLRRSPNILLIPGTSSLAHLRENLAAASLVLPDDGDRGAERHRGSLKHRMSNSSVTRIVRSRRNDFYAPASEADRVMAW